MSLPTVWILSVLVAAVALVARYRRARLPPGPRGIPLLGNILDIPKKNQWLTYAKWSQQYASDILYVNLAGTPVIILNSAKHTTELLEKRSSIYSDRTYSVMIQELMGWVFDFVFTPYGEEWRERRRLFHRHFNAQVIAKYHPHVSRHVRLALNRLLDRPNLFMEHFRHMAGALILSVTYGIEALPHDDPYLAAVQGAFSELAQFANGACLVDYIPVLKYIPAWFPGAGFKRKAAKFRRYVALTGMAPFSAVKRAMADGTASSSVVASLLEEHAETEDNATRETVISDVGGTTFVAGANTTVSALAYFILAMLLYPDVQRKAREEIDRVVGQDRLPECVDQTSIPYITAIVREVLRWKPVTTLVDYHRLTKDDEYLGYYIPEGALVVGNAWAILHDEAYYPDPDRFNPERFLTKEGTLDPNVPDPGDIGAFGFGRRICPGRHFASTSIWLMIASILSTFELDMPTDSFGNKIRPSGEVIGTGFVSYPVPFQCVFKPRSAQAEALIRNSDHEMD